jgi:tetratricopeptide (TPR) repeat protein
MSEQKSAQVAASVNTGMSVGSSKHPGRVRFQARLFGVVLFVLIIIATTAWYVFLRPSSKSTVTPVKNAASAPPSNISLDQKAQYYADEGQYEQAEQSWQEKLAGTKDTDGKVSIYYQQTVLAVKFKHYADAKKYADEAKQLAPTSPAPYAALALLAEAQNNNAQAKQYWQQAINHVDTSMPGYNLIKADYQGQLDALK